MADFVKMLSAAAITRVLAQPIEVGVESRDQARQ
jgi:hypothetical protein